MGITKPFTYLHTARSTSTQLYLPPSTFTQIISTFSQLSATPLITLLEPKYCTQLGNFPKFRQKNSKSSILTKKWRAGCLRLADSQSGLRFLKFLPQNPFLGKFGPKKSKLSVSRENEHTWYLQDPDSYSNFSFLNFQP